MTSSNSTGARFLAICIAFWPALAGAILLLPGAFNPALDYFVYRGIGHLVLVAALLIAMLMNLRKTRLIHPEISVVNRVLIALVLIAVVYSTAFAEPDFKLLIPFALYHYLALMAILCAVSLFSKWSPDTLGSIWNAMFVSMLLYLPVFAVIILSDPRDSHSGWLAPWVPFQNVRWFAAMVAIALAAGIAGSWRGEERSRLLAMLRVFGLFILWTILFWSGSRAQILGVFGALGLLFILGGALGRNVVLQAMKIAAPALLLSALLPTPTGSYGLLPRLSEATQMNQSLEVISSNRSTMWTASVQTILERPLFGHGIGQFFPATGYRMDAFHSHSFPIEAVLTLGFIGGGALIALVFGLYGRLTRNASRIGFPRETIPPFLVMSTILFMSLISGGVLLFTVSIYFILAAVGFWASIEQHQSRSGKDL